MRKVNTVGVQTYLMLDIQPSVNNKRPGFPDFAGNLRPQKFNKTQTNQLNIMGVQYYCRIWSCLRVYQQEWCQIFLILYPILSTLPHKLIQLPLLPPYLPKIGCTATNRVRLHHQYSMPPPWFGRSCKRI